MNNYLQNYLNVRIKYLNYYLNVIPPSSTPELPAPEPVTPPPVDKKGTYLDEYLKVRIKYLNNYLEVITPVTSSGSHTVISSESSLRAKVKQPPNLVTPSLVAKNSTYLDEYLKVRIKYLNNYLEVITPTRKYLDKYLKVRIKYLTNYLEVIPNVTSIRNYYDNLSTILWPSGNKADKYIDRYHLYYHIYLYYKKEGLKKDKLYYSIRMSSQAKKEKEVFKNVENDVYPLLTLTYLKKPKQLDKFRGTTFEKFKQYNLKKGKDKGIFMNIRILYNNKTPDGTQFEKNKSEQYAIEGYAQQPDDPKEAKTFQLTYPPKKETYAIICNLDSKELLNSKFNKCIDSKKFFANVDNRKRYEERKNLGNHENYCYKYKPEDNETKVCDLCNTDTNKKCNYYFSYIENEETLQHMYSAFDHFKNDPKLDADDFFRKLKDIKTIKETPDNYTIPKLGFSENNIKNTGGNEIVKYDKDANKITINLEQLDISQISVDGKNDKQLDFYLNLFINHFVYRYYSANNKCKNYDIEEDTSTQGTLKYKIRCID